MQTTYTYKIKNPELPSLLKFNTTNLLLGKLHTIDTELITCFIYSR
ncbi:hypothetical protein PAUR_b1271 [Pseudoalteromonas aurantia 208]|uniref:Uncharacterized protein n=1 Tax=Pseudoalteromonas aurantia 208 TaxID=1314867 RepID=A0ABR9EJT3_9GAMM|nr:hypothetical protein [Pseudoalteromonas aurantia 208]